MADPFFYLSRIILGFFTKPLDELHKPSERHLQLFEEGNALMQPYWDIPAKDRQANNNDKLLFKQASENYQQIIKENPVSWPAYLNLGKSQRAFKLSFEAHQSFSRAYQAKPDNAEVIGEYVRSCLENNEIKTAATVLKVGAKSFPDSILLKQQIIYILLLSNDPQKALTTIDNILHSLPKNNPNYDAFKSELNRLQKYSEDLLMRKIMPPAHVTELLNTLTEF